MYADTESERDAWVRAIKKAAVKEEDAQRELAEAKEIKVPNSHFVLVINTTFCINTLLICIRLDRTTTSLLT